MALHPKYALYYSLRSPFARRIRVAMQKLALPFEPLEIDVFKAPPEFYAANPLGQLPVLLINDGKEGIWLPDSSTILEYLDETYGGKVWPTEPGTRMRVRAASMLAVGLMTDTVRWYLESIRPQPSPEWTAEYVENIDRTLTAVQAMPWKKMPWKVSDFQLTQAGYDLYVALDYLRIRMKSNVLDWQRKYPELASFLEMHRSRQDLAPTSPPA